MSSPTTSLPTWATDATVATGADVGLTSRLEPSGAAKGQGYLGDQAIAARVDNWRAGSVGDWLSYLAPIQLRNWTREFSGLAVSTWSAPLLQPMAVATGAGWLIPASNAGGDDCAAVFLTPGTKVGVTESSSSIVEFTGCKCPISIAHSPAGGSVVLGVIPNVAATDTAVWEMGETGAGISKTTLSASAGGAGKVCYEATTGRFLAFDERPDGWQTGKLYWIKDGGSWTSRTISGSATGRDIHQVFAANGLIFITYADSNAIRVSSDGGETWVLQSTAGGTAGVTGICATGTSYLCIDNDGQVYRQFGDLWIPVGDPLENTQTGESDNVACSGFVYYGNHMASDGGRFVVVPWALGGRGHGVHWSSDAGVTWHTETIEASTSSTHLAVRGVCYGNGEFLLMVQTPSLADATAVCSVYRSLRL